MKSQYVTSTSKRLWAHCVQVLNDKLIETAEELSGMEDIKNNDVVVLAHVHLKHTQVETKNAKMFMEAQSSKEVYKALMLI